MATEDFVDLQLRTARPSVYLDQWVWVRLALAAVGRPRASSDVAVLDGIRDASAAGVVFPLSVTHYFETSKVTNPRQRRDLAAVMAPISCCQTLRGGRALLRHQVLCAMHEALGRPAFRPPTPEVLGIGVSWAVAGEAGHFGAYGPGGPMTDDDVPGLTAWLRRANQFAESQFPASPPDEELDMLRRHGYRPESTIEAAASRLAWETIYVGMLHDDPISREELRVRVQAREIMHEHLELLNEAMARYRVSLNRALGIDPTVPGSGRTRMVAFVDRIRSMRIAVDLKTELFRDASRTWKVNDLHDIDALSVAVPYCHVVVADKDATDRLRRSKAGARHGTLITNDLRDLLPELADLKVVAQQQGGDPTGWDKVGPGVGFSLEPPSELNQSGA